MENNEKKTQLPRLEVRSFVTTPEYLSENEQKEVRGGSYADTGITSIRVFC